MISKTFAWLPIALLLALTTTALAADPTPKDGASATMEVKTLKMATSMEGRKPHGVSDSFDAASTPKVYAFMVVKNRGEESKVTVVWEREGKVVGQWKLRVGRSGGWKTWAVTRINAKRKGAWTVRVLDPSGNELAQTAFTVR